MDILIPTKESNGLKILTFKEAQTKKKDCAKYDESNWIYIPNFYSEYRYILGTVGEKPLITIGINPSTAEPEKLDNTLRSVNRVALNNGFDSFIMFNVYAQRATRTDDMDKVFNQQLHVENMKAFRWLLEQSGNEYQARWCVTGRLSKKGHPHHPLYLGRDSVLRGFDMEDYLLESI